MRRLALAALFVLAAPAVAVPVDFDGELSGKGSGRVPGLPKQKLTVSEPGTTLTLDAETNRFAYSIGADSLGGSMTPTRKAGRFKVVQPTGPDLDALIAQTEAFLSAQAGLDLNLTAVTVAGGHAVRDGGLTVKSRLKLKVEGTTEFGGLPFKGKAKLKYAGATQ